MAGVCAICLTFLTSLGLHILNDVTMVPEYIPGRTSPNLRVVCDLRYKEEISNND